MNPTLLMLDHSISNLLLKRTKANKKVEGKSMYKVIIKLSYSSGKKNPNHPKLPFPLFTGMGNRGFGVFTYRTLQNEQLFFFF